MHVLLFIGALFVVVFDLEIYGKEMKYYPKAFQLMIGDWVNMIIAKVPSAAILIVPTHLDKVDKNKVEKILKDVFKRMENDESRRVRRIKALIEEVKKKPNAAEKLQTLEDLLKKRPIFPNMPWVSVCYSQTPAAYGYLCNSID